MVIVRDFRAADAPVLWTLSTLPNIGATADPDRPLALPPAAEAPAAFSDLADIPGEFDAFVVAEYEGHIVGMGGFARNDQGQAEVYRVRVHPATRRLGVGRAVMAGLESRAAELGLTEMYLDTATNQPEAVAFYRGLGYEELGTETRPEWTWTLVYFRKVLTAYSSTSD
ncbi:GNAT family N-acetyltransferase [Longispora albida]|uniref:GNAT family N-acetyltransferase n=1 Tax=Longispora albida TaxID=203523 RepID=UPI00035CFCA8|nr:GNAT family N-acetyltransferase [Longispora albida]